MFGAQWAQSQALWSINPECCIQSGMSALPAHSIKFLEGVLGEHIFDLTLSTLITFVIVFRINNYPSELKFSSLAHMIKITVCYGRAEFRQEYGYFSVKQSLYREACHENTKLSNCDLL